MKLILVLVICATLIGCDIGAPSISSADLSVPASRTPIIVLSSNSEGCVVQYGDGSVEFYPGRYHISKHLSKDDRNPPYVLADNIFWKAK